ncbi:MAG TPA: hypothetical protein VKQ72_13785 [Aggregatilineales bacterium]|nr:hypothetical protein [Aggregatilineales bacterium]
MQKPSPGALILLCGALCIVLFLCAFALRSHPNIEWDEGVYLTTFNSVQHGYPLYSQTYLSQPPGFFVATFPLYAVFGSTLESGRLAIFLYSLAGLMGIVWLGWELESPVFSFVAISLLYLIPIYTDQILTFHDNSLPSTFSVLALAAMFRFQTTARWRCLSLSALCVTCAILIKADISVLPSLFFILTFSTLVERKSVRDFIKGCGIFAVTALLLVLVITVPFGLSNVVADVVQLRIQAANTSSADPALFVSYLKNQSSLIGLTLLGVVLAGIVVWKKKDKRLSVLMMGLWALSTYSLLLIYHPLMESHVVFLAVPTVLLFSFSLYTLINTAPLSRFIPIGAAVFTIIMLMGRATASLAPPAAILNDSQTRELNIVTSNTQPSDTIVTDDGVITGIANRFTPPDLTDTSFIRIDSGELTSQAFENSLVDYQPKLIMTWTGRLVRISDFDRILQRHNYVLAVDLDYYHRAYLLQP